MEISQTQTPVSTEQAPVSPIATEQDSKLNLDPALLERVNNVQLQALKEKQKLKRERDEFTKQQKEFQEQMQKWESDIYQKSKNPQDAIMEEMEKNGKYISPEELEEKVQEKVLKRLEEESKKKEQAQTEEKAISEYKNEIKTFVDSGEYPAIKMANGHEYIYQVIIEDLQTKMDEYGQEEALKMIMPKEEAAKKVEQYLDSQLDNLLKSELARNYLLKKLQPEQGSQPQPKSPLTQNTLTNDFNPGSTDPQPRALTREESIARAAKMIKFR